MDTGVIGIDCSLCSLRKERGQYVTYFQYLPLLSILKHLTVCPEQLPAGKKRMEAGSPVGERGTQGGLDNRW